jgi:signal transduction histidine kinase/CheY-like chemotaxis protein/PAS domain-containing protein
VTLLLRLFLLVAVALLPAIAVQSYNEFDLRRSRQVEVQDQVLGLAKLAAAEQQQIVQGVRQTLIALSEIPAIKAKDAKQCQDYLYRIRERYPEFISFIVVDLNGDVFCDSSGQFKPETAAGRAYFTDAVKTGTFSVGGFAIGRRTGRKVLHFAVPFYDDDARMAGVVVAALSLDWLADYIAQNGVQPGAVLAITDRDGTYLARYPDNETFVGRKMPGDQSAYLGGPGTITTRDLDGVERIVGYSALQTDAGQLLVTIGIEKELAFGAIQSRTRLGIFLIVLCTSVALAFTLCGARRFIRDPLTQLIDAANQWRLGDYASRVHIQDEKSEISRVAKAFNTMADALADREHELCDAKEKAEQAAARITTIFESTNDCVLIVDPDWTITYHNQRARMQLAGSHDLLGLNLCETFPGAVSPDVAAGVHDAVPNQRAMSFETCYRDVWYEVNAFPSGEGIAVLFRDVTEHKHAVEARRTIEERLHQSQKMEAVGQLTGGVAHDFNNLLMVISGNLELIDDCVRENDGIRQLAASARKAADRGASLTAQLLAFSRKQTLNPKPVHAGTLTRDFEGLILRAIGEGSKVRIVSDDPLYLCHVDPAQLETALLNLVLNARDAMPDGGTLEIETRNMTLDDDAVTGVAAGSYVRLSVTDTGRGMTRETLDRVFEPFFTTKEVGKGTGLGLSMVYGFVRQSGGHVTIESTLGMGTTVSLYLPKSSKMPEAQPQIAARQDLPVGSGRILMVEDDDEVLDVTSTMLKQLGYQVFCARSGIDAVQLLMGEEKFDLLFSDVVMPQGINGIELARQAKRLRNGIKIVLTSGNAADVLARHGAEDEFPIIGKPFRRAELAQYLKAAMHGA